MNSRWLWNSHQKHKFLRGRGIWEHFENSSIRNGICRGFQGAFFTAYRTLFHQNTHKTDNNAVEMSQAFQDIARFEHFTDLNLLKYVFDVIQNWETDALQFYPMVLSFC